MAQLRIGLAEFEHPSVAEPEGDAAARTEATSAVSLLTSPRPVSLRVQRMRSPARSSINSVR